MLKDGEKVTMHFINHWGYNIPTEIKTDATGKVYEVKTVNGKQGIDGNERKSPSTCNGEVFTPFTVYAWSVIFRNERTGELYRTNAANHLENVTGLKDGYIDKIKWIQEAIQ